MNLYSFAVTVAVLIAFASIGEATVGVDVSASTSVSSFTCMRTGSGVKFAIVRGWRSTGVFDTACPGTVNNAWAAGLSNVDVYMFPCYSCGDPKGQVSRLVSSLKSNSVRYGMIWLDVEGPGTYWSSSTSANVKFISDMIAQGNSLGVHLGLYTSQSQWDPITGGWTGASSLDLWYAHYDNKQSFSDFKPFGGWTKPAIKQYKGDTTLCSSGVDLNWY